MIDNIFDNITMLLEQYMYPNIGICSFLIVCVIMYMLLAYINEKTVTRFSSSNTDDTSDIEFEINDDNQGNEDNEDGEDNEDNEEDFDNSEITLIGITGRKRSGKDTSGERLVNNHGFVRIAFADALKEACINIFGFSREQVYGDDLKEVIDEYWEYSPREVLQKVGTELFREALSQPGVLPKIGKNIWVRTIERKILNLAKQGYRRFVITDIRFANELEFLKEVNFNAYSIKVVRQAVMTETDPSKLHSSEAQIDTFECDFEIKNDGTIAELQIAIDDIARMTEHNVTIESGNTSTSANSNDEDDEDNEEDETGSQ